MIYHEDIFYPSEKDALMKLVSPIEDAARHKAFILPHMALEYIAHLYRKAFASIPDGTRIIGLFPLHREVLERDKGTMLFSSEMRDENTPLGTVRIEDLPFPSATPYEEEEYSMELLLPFIAYHNPKSVFHPLFVSVKNSEDMKKLSRILSGYDDGNTVFIISSNMTGRLDDGIEEERNEAVNLILSSEHLMDAWMKGKLKACGAPLAEAVTRFTGGRWKLIGISEKETKAGHAAFILEDE